MENNTNYTSTNDYKALRAFQMGINFLLGSDAVSVFDSNLHLAKETAHHFLIKVYDEEYHSPEMCNFEHAAQTAVTWFNDDLFFWMNIYNKVELKIKELFNNEIVSIITTYKADGQTKIESRSRSIIRNQMIIYRDHIMPKENIKKYEPKKSIVLLAQAI